MQAAKRAALAVAACLVAGPAAAEIAVSANDGNAVLKNGVAVVATPPVPSTVAVIDLSANPPKVLAEIEAPASVAGPPLSVAVAPDESFALVTGAQRIEGTGFVPDDKLAVIDLKASPPRVAATLEAGKGAAGVSINRAGTLALVANRGEGTVSVFTIAGGALTPAAKIPLGEAKSGPSHAMFTRDGRMALVTRDGDNRVSVLNVEGTTVTDAKRDMFAGMRPYSIDTAGPGDIAIVGSIGMGQGDADTISVIDLKARPPRVVNTISVGQTPEGLKVSPDGSHVAVTVMNGSNKAPSSPFYGESGLVKVYRITGHALALVAEAPVGHWCQGAVWSKDGRTLLVQCMVERDIASFRFDGKGLEKTGTLTFKGGPAGMRTAEP